MNFTINIDKKILIGFLFGGLIATTALFVQPSKAQAISSLSGQYGCILNRNFGGLVVPGGNGTDGSITGSNFMMYFDFTGRTAQMSVLGLKYWGHTNKVVDTVALTTGTFPPLSAGPLTNSFKATVDFTYQGNSGNIATYNLMSVNGGTTLLVQEGTTGNNDGEPTTGVCNKV